MKGRSKDSSTRQSLFTVGRNVPLGAKMLLLSAFLLNMGVFRWVSWEESDRVASAVESVLRDEYSTASSFQLSRALSDLEALQIIKCVRLVEQSGVDRTYFDTTLGPSCARTFLTQYLFVDEAQLKAGNGLIYKLTFQVPVRWQGILLEVLGYALISSIGIFYLAHIRNQNVQNALVRDSAELLIAQAKMVAHDIRSPLVALESILNSDDAAPAEQRALVSAAASRIREIANQLLHGTSTGAVEDLNAKQHLAPLAAVLKAIVDEKKAHLRGTGAIEICYAAEGKLGLVSPISPAELSRIISNLINNSIEAIDGPGSIQVWLDSIDESNYISIRDTGRGIPANVLLRIGEKGFSFGKSARGESGMGLGIHHATSVIERSGGKIKIDSTEGKGTQITVQLPAVTSSSMLIDKIELTAGQSVISLDDDPTIHQLWKNRLESIISSESRIRFHGFTALADLKEWIDDVGTSKALFLIDQQLSKEDPSGLEIVEQLGISGKAILVTTMYGDRDIQDKARSVGVRILPKNLASQVPICLSERRTKFAAVLIDDDLLIHELWRRAAKRRRVDIICFESKELFLRQASEIDLSSPLFIDVNFKDGNRGEDIAVQAAELGFTEIALATGLSPKQIRVPSCVRRVVGKEPFPMD